MKRSIYLYVGNFLFAAVIGIFVAWFYKRHESNIGTIRLVVIGAKTAVAGIVAACIMILLLLLIFVPEIFRPQSVSHLSLQGSPAQFSGKNHGFGKILFLNALLWKCRRIIFYLPFNTFSVMKNIYPDERKSKQTVREEDPKKNYHL